LPEHEDIEDMHTRVKAAWALACLLIGASAAQAQSTRAEMDRDAQELRQYRLTMPKVKQMAAATLAFAREVEKDPAVRASKQLDREIETLETKGNLTEPQRKELEQLRAKRDALDKADADKDTDDGLEDPKTLADMTRRIEREPRLATAIKNAGLTSREYSLLTLTFFQAMFVHMMQKSAGAKELPQGILPENLQFVQQNEAELTQIFSQLQAEDKN
jgi:hypothetical protein